jgi:DNA polymerase I-like protein with 3'-5' exonuclease and polymerase domains
VGESPLSGVQLHLVDTLDEALALKRWLGERRLVLGVDTESSGLDPMRDELRLVQVGDRDTGWAIPWPLWGGLAQEVLRKYEGPMVLHNLPFDKRMLSVQGGIDLPWHKLHDTLILAALDDPMRARGLKPLSKRLIDPRADSGQRALDDGMKRAGWNWGTVPYDFAPYWCVPETTEILTQRGWKNVRDIRPMYDITYGYMDGSLVRTPITQVHKFKDQPVVRFGNRNWNTVCTENHRWLVEEMDGNRNWPGKASFATTREAWHDAPVHAKGEKRLILTGYADGGSSNCTAAEASIIAWLLSDGSIQWQRPRSSPSPSITQSVDKFHDEIRELLRREGAYVSERFNENSRCYTFQVSASYVQRLWDAYDLFNDDLSVFVLGLSQEARAAWLLAWYQAEGTLGKKEIAQNKGRKLDAIALTVFLEGYRPGLSLKSGKCWTVRLNERPVGRSKNSSEMYEDAGRADVWCPTTVLGSWVARDKDGRIFVTGNCYSALDPVLTSRLYEYLYPRVMASCPQAYDVELAVNKICVSMMLKGIRIDREYIARARERLETYTAEARTWLDAAYGITSVLSAKQISTALDKHGEPPTERTGTGLPKVDKEFLGRVRDYGSTPEAREIAEQVLGVRHAEKMISAYLENFIKSADADDIVRCQIWQAEAVTGRMSITSPALQTLSRDDTFIRGSFIPRPDHVFISADYGQLEGRLAAHYSQDEDMIQMFLDSDAGGTDFFAGIASQIWQKPVSKKDQERQLCKNVVYGACFGAGVAKMAQTAGVSYETMRPVKEAFDARYPGLKRFTRDIVAEAKGVARRDGRPAVRSGLKRYLPVEPGKEYVAVNRVIQAEGAEVLKLAMLELDAAGFGPSMRIPVHDEIFFEVHKDEAQEACHAIEEAMCVRDKYRVPLLVKAEILPERWQKG